LSFHFGTSQEKLGLDLSPFHLSRLEGPQQCEKIKRISKHFLHSASLILVTVISVTIRQLSSCFLLHSLSLSLTHTHTSLSSLFSSDNLLCRVTTHIFEIAYFPLKQFIFTQVFTFGTKFRFFLGAGLVLDLTFPKISENE
jgi:hypothetical protein